MTSRLPALILASCVLAACSSASSGTAAPSRTVSVGVFTVETLADGDNFVSLATAARTDDSLTVTFERASHTARLEPRYGQARSVPVDSFPDDVDAANHRVADPLAFGMNKAGAAAVSSTRPQSVDLPSPACANPCFQACDAQFPEPVQSAACRFGCTNGCTQR